VAQSREETSLASADSVAIPGPLQPFLRMAGVSQKVSPDEVLPLVARSVEASGYAGQGRSQKPNEFLVLLTRYVKQARELQALAGQEGVIRVSNCSAAQPLLTILGYRLRRPCGPDTSVETDDPEKAFLTIDSGFPLTDLEETLRGGKPFVHPFPTSRVPILFSASDWTANNRNGTDVLDLLLRDPARTRLYWAMAGIEKNTGMILRQSPGLEKLVPLAPVLDFYGKHIYIRAGRAVVPGGIPAESAWKKLVGASPESQGEFVARLLAKDGGWLAAYFDALSWGSATQQAYFTESSHLQRFYEALCGRDLSPGPARPVFRPHPGLLLLVTRLQFEADGQPHIPGNLEIWRDLLQGKSDFKMVREWAGRDRRWNSPDQLVEGMVAQSRVDSDDGPLKVFLALSEIDRWRSPEQRLNSQTVRLLAKEFSRFRNQYLIFSEFHWLNNASVTRFISVAEAIDSIPDPIMRADALGIFQANVGLWQILARQGQIPNANSNDSWQRVINPFAGLHSSAQLFDASRSSLGELLRAASGRSDLTEDEIIALLAGPSQTNPVSAQVRLELAQKMRSVLDAQRLVRLDTLFALADGLNKMTRGEVTADTLIPLAGVLREFEMPKPLFTNKERTEWDAEPYHDPHLELEMGTDLAKLLKSRGSSKKLAEARGQIVPFLRDSLVALNYAYYEPPGAQMVYNNALFVRSHDFSGATIMEGKEAWQTPRLYGRGRTAGGGAHLAGSLADLPYVLAQVEQQFIVPENVQSLIWEDLVPDLLTSAVVPRWWRVTRNELHAVTLYQRFGEELLAAAAENEKLRQRVMDILYDRMLPQSLEQVEETLHAGHGEEAISHLVPAETFYLAAEFRRRFPEESNKWTKSGQELEELSQRYRKEISWERLSVDFGVPHPAFAQTYARELLNVKPLPTVFGYSSRLLAESWESNNLYWARLADEMDYPPVMLNLLVPELTRCMVEKIFASHLEDRPALLRALRETGEEFRLGKIGSLPKSDARAGF
jgi:hypothetical protein